MSLEFQLSSAYFGSVDSGIRTVIARASVEYEKGLRKRVVDEPEHVRGILFHKYFGKEHRRARSSVREALRRFDGNVEMSLAYMGIMEYVRRNITVYSPQKELKDKVALAIRTGKPIKIYLPRCLRYFYPNGDQQILDNLDDVEYETLTGETQEKKADGVFESIEKDLEFVYALSKYISVEVVIPIMDTEVRRPERMNTQSNYDKVRRYTLEMGKACKGLIEGRPLNLSVVSAIETFGNPSENPQFEDIIQSVRHHEVNQYGVSRRTYEHQKDLVSEVVGLDDERIDYYRSREFAGEIVLYEIADGIILSEVMSRKDVEECAAVMVRVPSGSEFYGMLYARNGLMVYSR